MLVGLPSTGSANRSPPVPAIAENRLHGAEPNRLSRLPEVLRHARPEPLVSGWTHPDRAIRRSDGRIVDTFCERLRKRTTPDFIAAFGLRLPRSQKASLLPLSPSMRVWRSTVYRWIARYLAERAPCSLADGERSGRSRMTPAPTHAVQQILAQVSVAAHLAIYLGASIAESLMNSMTSLSA